MRLCIRDRWLSRKEVNLNELGPSAVYFDRWYQTSMRSGAITWVPIVFEDGFML
jgi:hypothetical protein